MRAICVHAACLSLRIATKVFLKRL